MNIIKAYEYGIHDASIVIEHEEITALFIDGRIR